MVSLHGFGYSSPASLKYGCTGHPKPCTCCSPVQIHTQSTIHTYPIIPKIINPFRLPIVLPRTFQLPTANLQHSTSNSRTTCHLQRQIKDKESLQSCKDPYPCANAPLQQINTTDALPLKAPTLTFNSRRSGFSHGVSSTPSNGLIIVPSPDRIFFLDGSHCYPCYRQ